jgi:TonB family protein
MAKRRHYRLALLLLASVCAAGLLLAQDDVVQPLLLEHGEAKTLVVYRPHLEYPSIAKVNYIQGQVRLELTVNAVGTVSSAHVLEGDPLLAAAAMNTVNQWLFRPATKPSGPAGFVTTVRLKYNLGNWGTRIPARQAEEDFLKQVKPVQVVEPPGLGHTGEAVHLRVLVNAEGKAVDIGPALPGDEKYEAACAALRSWTFHPAHWGSLPVASYVDINVPINRSATPQSAAVAANQPDGKAEPRDP